MKTEYVRQTTVLSVMLVLVGLVFLISAITEKAQASIKARAISHVGSFSNVRWHLSAGKFLLPPIKEGKDIIWITIGNGLFGGGDERGYVRANVGTLLVTFEFYNPARGANTCAALPPLYTTCTITQGVHARIKLREAHHHYQTQTGEMPVAATRVKIAATHRNRR